MNENHFQAQLIKKLHNMFPGCIVLKQDANYIQGMPDLLILYNDKWAALECKKNEKAKHRPNQDYYVDKLGKMSYASFIFPENEEAVLHDIQRAFRNT